MTALEQPIASGALRSVNFFNGRLLTGTDLGAEQESQREARRRLGRAVGTGVVEGLFVGASGTPAEPAVVVTKGLAVNPAGDALEVSDDVTVPLTEPSTTGTGAARGQAQLVFRDCTQAQTGPAVLVDGVFVLTLGAVRTAEGRAPVSGLANAEADCNVAWLMDKVAFRLVRVTLPAGTTADTRVLRNAVAHLMFGTVGPDRPRVLGDPYGSGGAATGLLGALRRDCLRDDEVPLAVLRWTRANGLEFCDSWAVRRRAAGPSAGVMWPSIAGDAALARSEAIREQFQAHLAELQGPDPGGVRALDHFAYLPAAGVVAANWTTFFDGLLMAVWAERTEAFVLRALDLALRWPPFRIDSGLFLWGMQPVIDGEPSETTVFLRGDVPLEAVARFNAARFDQLRVYDS